MNAKQSAPFSKLDERLTELFYEICDVYASGRGWVAKESLTIDQREELENDVEELIWCWQTIVKQPPLQLLLREHHDLSKKFTSIRALGYQGKDMLPELNDQLNRSQRLISKTRH